MATRDTDQDGEEEKRRLFIFGRDVSEIPCFRSSFLYGGGSAFATAVAAFLATSRPQLSCHVGMAGFVCVTLGYWFTCRYDYSQKKFFYNQLKPAMRKQAIYEGTTVEEEATRNAKTV